MRRRHAHMLAPDAVFKAERCLKAERKRGFFVVAFRTSRDQPSRIADKADAEGSQCNRTCARNRRRLAELCVSAGKYPVDHFARNRRHDGALFSRKRSAACDNTSAVCTVYGGAHRRSRFRSIVSSQAAARKAQHEHRRHRLGRAAVCGSLHLRIRARTGSLTFRGFACISACGQPAQKLRPVRKRNKRSERRSVSAVLLCSHLFGMCPVRRNADGLHPRDYVFRKRQRCRDHARFGSGLAVCTS